MLSGQCNSNIWDPVPTICLYSLLLSSWMAWVLLEELETGGKKLVNYGCYISDKNGDDIYEIVSSAKTCYLLPFF